MQQKSFLTTLIYRGKKGGSDMDSATAALVLRAKSGDTAAFGELYGKYSKELYSFACYFLGSSHSAEDAVQDAVLSAFKQIQNLRNPDGFRAWMLKILSSVCKRLYTQNEQNKNTVSIEDNPDVIDGDGVDGLEISIELKEALRILSAEERAVILLSVVCGYKSHEVSEILDISASTVRSKQSRGLKKMQTFLNENGKKGGNKNEQEE